tara:strand:- start:145 stop:576 length:432 start_codon:yes stop_codon:yes gene_type:complete
MFKSLFKKKVTKNENNKSILVAALLIHAAKIDESYTGNEKNIIIKALVELDNISENKAKEVVELAEKKEKESNQIVEYTREVKKESIDFKLKIIEILWKIVYSDGLNDSYESNLIRRVCGLLYISDKDSGIIKIKVKNSIKDL